MSTTYYHGSHRLNQVIHHGICLTDDERTAREYAGDDGHVLVVEVDEDGLDIAEVEGYDHDVNTAPGDDGDAQGHDALRYDDEDERGREHETLRLMSVRALASARIIDAYTMDDE